MQIALFKLKRKELVLLLGFKHLPVNIRCSHKTTISDSEFVPSKRPFVMKRRDMVHHGYVKFSLVTEVTTE